MVNVILVELILIAAAWQLFVDRVSGNTTWIQNGTVLTDWQNTRTDSVLLLVQVLYCELVLDTPFLDYKSHRKRKSYKYWFLVMRGKEAVKISKAEKANNPLYLQGGFRKKRCFDYAHVGLQRKWKSATLNFQGVQSYQRTARGIVELKSHPRQRQVHIRAAVWQLLYSGQAKKKKTRRG